MTTKGTEVSKTNSTATAVVAGLATVVFLVLLLAVAGTIFWHGVTGDVGGWTQFALVAGGLGLLVSVTSGIFKGIYNAGKESR